MGNLNWAAIIPEAVKQADAYRREYNEAPTLRGIYYRLISIGVIPNTRSVYKGLSRVLSDARLEGTFPWGLMVDNVRASTGAGDETTLKTVKHWASTETRDKLTRLENAFTAISNPHVYFRPARWAAQEKRVVLAIEKDAILGAVKSVTQRMDIEIFPLRGYSSTTFMKQLAECVSRLSRYGEVQLLIITDYDPSGEDIARDVEDRLRDKFGVDCTAEKILLTKPQIIEHDLPAIPGDAEEIAKMQRDSRWDKWTDGVFRVELDAMAAIKPAAFKEIINDAVAKHYDGDLSIKQGREAAEACEAAEEELRGLYGELEEVHDVVRERIEEIRAQEEA